MVAFINEKWTRSLSSVGAPSKSWISFVTSYTHTQDDATIASIRLTLHTHAFKDEETAELKGLNSFLFKLSTRIILLLNSRKETKAVNKRMYRSYTLLKSNNRRSKQRGVTIYSNSPTKRENGELGQLFGEGATLTFIDLTAG